MLRADLRQAREAAALTQYDVAGRMGWSVSKVARVESGDVGISDNDLRDLVRMLGMGDTATREMVRRNEASRGRGWWHDYRTIMPPALLTLVGMEAEVDRTCEYAIGIVPGIFQTADYTRALFERISTLDEDAVEQRVILRQLRQRNLLDRLDPPELMIVLDESALFRSMDRQEMMASQISRVAELARRPHIQVRVLPFEGLHYSAHGFMLVANEFAYVEMLTGDMLIDDAQRLRIYTELFDMLWRDALDADRTGQLLQRVAKDYAGGRQPRPWLWE